MLPAPMMVSHQMARGLSWKSKVQLAMISGMTTNLPGPSAKLSQAFGS